MGGMLVLIAFVLAFIGIVVWAFLPRNKERMKKDAEIPFREERDDR